MNEKTLFILCISIFFFSMQTSHSKEEIFQHVILGEKPTRYIISEIVDETIEITAYGQDSASGLYSETPRQFFKEYPQLEWSWKVDKIHHNANIAIKDQEDFAASIQIVFGRNTLFSKSKVLVYAWVGNDEPVGHVIKSPRASNHFRTLILGNNQTALQQWQNYSRNILEDYKFAYGQYPDEEISAIGVFTDNDQTQQDVRSTYRLSFSSNEN